MSEQKDRNNEENLPQWAHDMKIAFMAYKDTYDGMGDEMNEVYDRRQPGRIDGNFLSQYRALFYEYIPQIVSKLPHPRMILCDERKPISLHLGSGKEWGSSVAQLPERTYYLPQFDAIIKIQLGYGFEDNVRYFPESDNFVGINKILYMMDNKASQPHGVYVTRLSHKSNDKFGGELSLGGMTRVVDTAKSLLKDEPEDEPSQRFFSEITRLEEERNSLREETEIRYANQLKHRTLNILKVFKNYPFLAKKLPRYIVGNNVYDQDKDDTGKFKKFFLDTETGNLLRAPVINVTKKNFLLGKRTIELPDIEKSEDAILTDWIKCNIENSLSSYIPQGYHMKVRW